MAIEKVLNRKMWPQYFGPMVVVSWNLGGTYIVCNMDGTLAHAPIAAFRVVPYFAHQELTIPDLKEHLDVSVACLCELERTTLVDPNNPEEEVESNIEEVEANNDNDL
jgi:hypothetical protein